METTCRRMMPTELDRFANRQTIGVDFAPDLILIFQAEQEGRRSRAMREKNATTPFAGSLRTIETYHVGGAVATPGGARRRNGRGLASGI